MGARIGVSYRTALNWFHAGELAVPARQFPTGAILAGPLQAAAGRTVAYCRVSSADHRDDLEVTTIVVEHRDRLARFGVEHLQAALSATGRSILVLNPSEAKDDLVRDMAEVLTSMCARLYGHRSAGQRADVRAARSAT